MIGQAKKPFVARQVNQTKLVKRFFSDKMSITEHILAHGEKITIRTLQQADAENAIQALLELGQHEVLNQCLNIPVDAHYLLYKKMVYENLHMGISFIAVSDKTNKIVGIVMNDISGDDSDDDESVDVEDYEDNRFKIIEALLDTLDEPVFDEDNPNSFYDKGKWLDLTIAAVAKEYQHQNLFSKMLQMSFEEAKQKGFSGVTVTCSSEYAHKACLKLGLKCINEISYADYVSSVTNDKPFAKLAETTPHKSIRLMHSEFPAKK